MEVRKVRTEYSVEGVDERGLIPKGTHIVRVSYSESMDPSISYHSRPEGRTLEEVSEMDSRLNTSRPTTRAEAESIIGYLQLLEMEPFVESLREMRTSIEESERTL